MNRRRVAVLLAAALSLIALAAFVIWPLLPWSVPSWTTSGGVTVQWRQDAAAGSHRVWFANNMVYATVNGLSALDPATGRQLWQTSVPNSQYLVVVDDTIFTTGVFAIDAATGTVKWHVHPGEGLIVVAEKDDARRVFVACDDGGACALDGGSGRRLWHTDVGNRVDAMATGEGMVYVGNNEGQVAALDAETGAERWRVSPAGPPGSNPNNPLVGNIVIPGMNATGGRVYVAIQGGAIVALDAVSGAEQWRWAKPMNSPPSAGTWFPAPPPVVANGMVYFATEYYDLFALEAETGREAWRLEVVWEPLAGPEDVPEAALPSALDFVDGTTGMRQWSASVGAIHQSPFFANGGFLVSACRNQNQNCALFQLDLATGERLWEVGTDGFGVPHDMAVTNGAIYGATTWSRIDRLLFYRVSGSDIFALALPPHPTA